MSTLREPSDLSNPPNYSFPSHRLSRILHNPQKHPIVLVACGSFSPVTYLHLRMFEMAKDYVRQNTDYEIVGGYLSPVSDKYKKPGLLNAHHRSTMCTLAAEQTSSWLMVDTWEAYQDYKRTAIVLDHFDHEINTVLGGAHTEDGEHRDVKVMLLAGSDLIGTMSEPGVWSYADLDHILGRYGTFIVERQGSAMDQATDSLAKWRDNIHLISQLIQNDVSSTKVRLFLRRGLSVRYLSPLSVVDYIEQNGLYLEDGIGLAAGSSSLDKGKGKESPSATGSASKAGA